MSSVKSPVYVPPKKIIDTTQQAIPFDTGNIPGPRMAPAVMPAVSGKMIARARRPLLVVGSQINNNDVLRRVIYIGQTGIQIAAVGNAFRFLKDQELDLHYVNLHALSSYLCDPNWPGLDGKGGYDLVAMLGITYFYASQAISAPKNFSTLKIISIDKYYHPNADLSFGNLTDDIFLAALDEIITLLQKNQTDS
jgi:acetyl-CoA decarbonylase/synthase complex subunit epsilon